MTKVAPAPASALGTASTAAPAIRDARAGDAAAIAEIANAAILGSTAIWSERPVTAEDRESWIAERTGAGFPVLVAVDAEDRVLGYASYGPFRPHDGYRLTVEHSVYVREGLRGGGIGRALLAAVIDRARTAGLHAMVAGIDAGNAGSIRLHERLGFERAGELRQVGAKFGEWLDLAFLVLRLDDAERPGARAQLGVK